MGPARGGHAWFLAAFLIATTAVACVTFARRARIGIATTADPTAFVLEVVVALLFWGVVLAEGRKVVWQLFGCEEIAATAEVTTITSRVFAFRRTRTVRTSEIRRVDWAEAPMRWARGFQRKFFIETNGRRIELRSQLSLVEANLLKADVWKHIQSLQRCVGDGGYRT